MSAFFIEGQAEGAIPNGTRVRKINSERGDTHDDGALATVRSSFGPVPAVSRKGEGEPEYGYFVEWDSHPNLPVMIAGTRIEAVP